MRLQEELIGKVEEYCHDGFWVGASCFLLFSSISKYVCVFSWGVAVVSIVVQFLCKLIRYFDMMD